MADPTQQPCVRGCMKPCPCPDCRDDDQPPHDPIAALQDKDGGLLCRRDNTRLFRWLSDVLADTVSLDTRLPVDYGWDKEGAHQKVTGSPALIRLDVAALGDRRTAFGVAYDPHASSSQQPSSWPENRDPHAPVDIPGTLCRWACRLAADQHLTTRITNMGEAVTLLLTWYPDVIRSLWVDDFYTAMREIRSLLDRAHDVERPKPMGSCFTCDAALYSRPGMSDVRCGKCGRRFDGMSLVALEVQRRREAGTG